MSGQTWDAWTLAGGHQNKIRQTNITDHHPDIVIHRMGSQFSCVVSRVSRGYAKLPSKVHEKTDTDEPKGDHKILIVPCIGCGVLPPFV